MSKSTTAWVMCLAAALNVLLTHRALSQQLELVGVTTTPHVAAPAMRYARDPDPELGCRVQLFIRNNGDTAARLDARTPVTMNGQSPAELVLADEWAWHDFPSAWPEHPLELSPGALTVWTFNGKRASWGVGTQAQLMVDAETSWPRMEQPISLDAPTAWISAVTFLSDDEQVVPDHAIVHVTNSRPESLEIVAFRCWVPDQNAAWRVLYAAPWVRDFQSWPENRIIAARDKGVFRVRTGPLPLSYAAVEVHIQSPDGAQSSLWAHLRIKREVFDISGGWVQGGKHAQRVMTFEPFLKTLRRMHINTAHIADNILGYTDQTATGGLYDRYPLKYFSALTRVEHYEQDAILPRVHAVEFLGEPQYGGGRPVPPMEVWQKLAPYQASKLPTTVTHSEERIWRYYAGLSDFPHYDAYRVCAPSPDAWFKYDRWEGKKIGWGAPLETIGDMCRSLRELNRPMPTAYWSQGPHHGWGPMWGRKRASPTPDELRLQAYHALASRITSLYWFNLSLPSLTKYPDTLDEITRVGREIRMLEEYYLQGDAYRYRRLLRDGQPDWDLVSIAAPHGALLFALDLDYAPNVDSQVFEFGPPREVELSYELPAWCRSPAEVFRIDADGTHDVEYEMADGAIELTDTLHKVGIYVVAAQADQRAQLDRRHQALVRDEEQLDFNPAHVEQDLATLVDFAATLSAD